MESIGERIRWLRKELGMSQEKFGQRIKVSKAHISKIAGELKVQPRQVAATAKLFAEGATVPFIARYRKEATGSLDEVAITSIRERLLSLAELEDRRATILKSLAERNLLTDQLKTAVAGAETLSALEDITSPSVPSVAPVPQLPKKPVWSPLPIFCSRSNPLPTPLPPPSLT
jgi:uncharacterized protein